MTTVLLITHGMFGQELLHTVMDIVGHQDAAKAIGVTSETGPESVSKALQDVRAAAEPEGLLILVDMLGGTPCNVALLKARSDAQVEIVSGVNLYMLISAFKNRNAMDLKSLAVKVAEDARRAIALPKELLSKKMGASS